MGTDEIARESVPNIERDSGGADSLKGIDEVMEPVGGSASLPNFHRVEFDRMIRLQCEATLEMIENRNLAFRQAVIVEQNLGAVFTFFGSDRREIEGLAKHLVDPIQRDDRFEELALMVEKIHDCVAVVCIDRCPAISAGNDLDGTPAGDVDSLARVM